MDAQIAMRQFVDNVAMLAVEMCLVDGLEDIFSPTVVARMSDEELKMIAGESPAVEELRIQLTEKKNRLKSALRQCLNNIDVSEPQASATAAAVLTPSSHGSAASNTPDRAGQNTQNMQPSTAAAVTMTSTMQRTSSGQSAPSTVLPQTAASSGVSSGAFGAPAAVASSTTAQAAPFSGLFNSAPRTNLFAPSKPSAPPTGLFGSSAPAPQSTSSAPINLFASSSNASPFGGTSAAAQPTNTNGFGSGRFG